VIGDLWVKEDGMMNGIKLWKGFAPPFLPLQDVFVIYI
jgi:hypothetical protein